MLALTDHKRSPGAVLRSWCLSVRVPVVAGGAGRRTRLPAKLTRLAQQDAAAGHAKGGDAPWFEDCGPGENAAGHGCGPRGQDRTGVLAGAEVDPWASSLARLRDHLKRARTWYAKRTAEADLTIAALAEREGVAPARISEALALLRLSPSIVADLDRPDRTGPVPTVADLERLARMRDRLGQVARYRQLCREAGAPGSKRRKGAARQKGFQHVLLTARQYQAWLDDGTYRSLREIAAAEQVTPGRVGQVLDLLTLPPEILTAIDVPAEQAPVGLTQMELRRIARLGSVEEQQSAFKAYLSGRRMK